MDFANRYLMRLGLVVAVLFFFSAVNACSEMRYWAFGKTTTATVTKIAPYKRRGRIVNAHVTYCFQNENSQKQMTHHSAVPLKETGDYHIGQEVPIEYFGSENYDSRLAGRQGLGWTWFLLGTIGAGILISVALGWQAWSR